MAYLISIRFATSTTPGDARHVLERSSALRFVLGVTAQRHAAAGNLDVERILASAVRRSKAAARISSSARRCARGG